MLKALKEERAAKLRKLANGNKAPPEPKTPEEFEEALDQLIARTRMEGYYCHQLYAFARDNPKEFKENKTLFCRMMVKAETRAVELVDNIDVDGFALFSSVHFHLKSYLRNAGMFV